MQQQQKQQRRSNATFCVAVEVIYHRTGNCIFVCSMCDLIYMILFCLVVNENEMRDRDVNEVRADVCYMDMPFGQGN